MNGETGMMAMGNESLRDMIIFGEEYRPEKYKNGLRKFAGLWRHELRLLMDEKIFDPYPWRRYMEYVWFMEKYGNDDQLYLHGFVYSQERTNSMSRQSGIVFEGIGRERKWDNEEAEKVFRFLFQDADCFEMDPPFVWYD